MNTPSLHKDTVNYTLEEQGKMKKAGELIYELSHLDFNSREAVMEWIYEFSLTASTQNTRQGYNIVLGVFESKGFAANFSLGEPNMGSKDGFGVYIIGLFLAKLRLLHPIKKCVQNHIVLWRNYHAPETNQYKVIVKNGEGEHVGDFIARIINDATQEQRTVYGLMSGVILKFEYSLSDMRTFDQKFQDFVADSQEDIKENLAEISFQEVPEVRDIPALLQSIRFDDIENVLDFLYYRIFRSKVPLSDAQLLLIEKAFSSNNFYAFSDTSPPRITHSMVYAKYIISNALMELANQKKLNNIPFGYGYQWYKWKQNFSEKEIWCPAKVVENNKLQLPFGIRRSVTDITEDKTKKK